MQYLTEDLLSSIKLRAMVPTSQATFQDADLIMLANEELQLKLVSDIMGQRENFFLTNQSTGLIAGVDTYTMPSRAIGNSLKVVWYVDAQGAKSKLTLKDVDELPDAIQTQSVPNMYYIQGDRIVIPMPTSSVGQIRFDFFARPNKLVATSTCAKIQGSTVSGGLVTFAVDTDLTASLSVGSLIDVVSMTSPFVLWGFKVPITAITSTSIQVSASQVSDAAGNLLPIATDYICPTGTANIAQVPQEFHPVLAQMVANRLLFALGDQAKYQLGMATLKEDRQNALSLIKNRVELSPQFVANSGFVGAFSRRF